MGNAGWEHALPRGSEPSGEDGEGVESTDAFDAEPAEHNNCVDKNQWEEDIQYAEANDEEAGHDSSGDPDAVEDDYEI